MPVEFIKDIIPFFCDKRLLYVDVGANVGNVFTTFYTSKLNIVEAHLFEPSKDSFNKLQEKQGNKGADLRIYNIGLSSETVKGAILSLDGTMSRVISVEEATHSDKKLQKTILRTLDSILDYREKHINILKIDVEGHEISALQGAVNLLSNNCVDMIYIEAGMNPNNTQQTYYRTIEDFLHQYNFSIFKIYEQQYEWPTNSPLLRRINIAFMNTAFAAKHPYNETYMKYWELCRIKAVKAEIKKTKRQ